MNEEQLHLAKLLDEAVAQVYKEERFLLTCSDGMRIGMEQAFVFRTGLHLTNLLQNTSYRSLDLDSEYNKNHGGIKRTINFPRGVRPDLIIHERDSNDQNKLIAEFKGYWRNSSQAGQRKIAKDLQKLEDLTNPEDAYKYSLGVFVLIGNARPEYKYFIDGHEI